MSLDYSELLLAVVKNKASDLHITAGSPPMLRVRGSLVPIEGVPSLSMLPAGTLLFFAGGATIKVDAQNGPCRIAGRSVAEHAGMADHEAGALQFPKVAKRLRGLVGWVEKPGRIARGEAVSVRVPEQWIYRG